MPVALLFIHPDNSSCPNNYKVMSSKISLHTCKPKRRRIRRPKVEHQLPEIDTEAAKTKAQIYGMYVRILDGAICAPSPINRRGQLRKFRATLKRLIPSDPSALNEDGENSTTVLLDIVEKILCLTNDDQQLRELVKLTNSLRGMYNHYRALTKETRSSAAGTVSPSSPAADGVQQTRPRPPARA
jgi:hypothetical protein